MMYLINRNKGYKINYLGHVVNASNNKIIKQRIDRAGYITVRLTQNGNTTTHFLHRLIAETFVPNTDNKPFVNHINGIKTDNRIENLEWVTYSENVQHAFDNGLNNASSKKIIDKCTGKIYNSVSNAAKELKINYSTCRAYLTGVIKSNKTCLEYLK